MQIEAESAHCTQSLYVWNYLMESYSYEDKTLYLSSFCVDKQLMQTIQIEADSADRLRTFEIIC